jgi:hypothetical protein
LWETFFHTLRKTISSFGNKIEDILVIGSKVDIEPTTQPKAKGGALRRALGIVPS